MELTLQPPNDDASVSCVPRSGTVQLDVLSRCNGSAYLSRIDIPTIRTGLERDELVLILGAQLQRIRTSRSKPSAVRVLHRTDQDGAALIGFGRVLPVALVAETFGARGPADVLLTPARNKNDKHEESEGRSRH